MATLWKEEIVFVTGKGLLERYEGQGWGMGYKRPSRDPRSVGSGCFIKGENSIIAIRSLLRRSKGQRW